MTREPGDAQSRISIVAAISTLVVVVVIGFALYRQDARSRLELKPRDVFEELQIVKADMKQQGKELNAEMVKLRESVNHSKELAAETKDKTDALAESLNAQIASLQKELRELNGKK